MATHTRSEARLRQVLKTLRKESGLTQLELGARINQPQQVVSKIERGERRLYATQLFEICQKGFGIGPAEFGKRYERQS